jgi:hypothetical protein
MNTRRMTRQGFPGGHDVARPGDGLGAKLVTTGMAWLVVYLLLLTLFSIFEDQLAALTLPVRLLVVSGVLVTVMANLVMPMVMRIVGGWIGRRSNTRPARVTKGGHAIHTHTRRSSERDVAQRPATQAIRRTNAEGRPVDLAGWDVVN